MPDTSLVSRFKSARSKSVPLVGISTPDPAATIRNLLTATNGSPAILWDCISGLRGMNPAGRSALETLCNEPSANLWTVLPEVLLVAANLPEKSLLFVSNADRFLSNDVVVQGIWNLRDILKVGFRTLVLLGPSLTLPASLRNDVIMLDEPLPDSAELEGVLASLHRDAGIDAPDPETMTRAVDAVNGLSAFSAEQHAAMSLTRAGLDVSALWEAKRKQVEQTRGLSIWRGGETFADVRGYENVKALLTRVRNGRIRPRAIVFMDELEKQFAGIGDSQDSTTKENFGELLTYMQDKRARGIINVGPPGSGKSLIAKATGNEFGVPTIALNIPAMKTSLLGETGENLRNALKVISAVSGDQTFWIATSNGIAQLPPEIKRRFKLGTFFFDLPSASERASIWELFLGKFGIPSQSFPVDDGWTGAEIEQCCDLAWNLDMTLIEASSYIVPVSKSGAEQIEKLRTQASGKFISASNPGVYRYEKTLPAVVSGRSLEVN